MSRVLVTRRSVLITLVIFSVISLGMQVYLLEWAGITSFSRLSSLYSADDGKHKHRRVISPFRATKLFANAAAKFDVPVFLIEPECLENISMYVALHKNNQNYRNCNYLCGSRLVTSFGILDASRISDGFLDHLGRMIDIKWTIFYGQDPRNATADHHKTPDIPLHYIFEYSGQFIHLVIFYERSSSYLWHGAVEDDPSSKRRPPRLPCIKDIELKRLKFGGVYAGAYNKMEFTITTADGVKIRIPKDLNNFLEQYPVSRYLECNHQRAREFKTTYGNDQTPEAEEFRQLAKDLLEKGKMVLDELGIVFWLSSGTCLGWFRECDIIPHSKDVDFGIRIWDYKSNFIQEFDNRGLTLKHQFGKVSDSFELSFLHDYVKLDIFFFYEETDHMWNGGTEARSGNKFKYVFPKFTLCWAEILGMKVRVPCNTRQYIEANYGTEWNQKVTSWDWKSSPPNVRPNGQWDRDEWPEVIQVF
ncbi:ribitol-5-phosphate transferase FKTN-like isoform X1 [Asterias amurensis]|uniref:ribitol-5-phosphate transferase FKTN-like isoform X1 n=3 Tax=Asterias amurensis TaxID=7602 RepID=UPI003AB5446B